MAADDVEIDYEFLTQRALKRVVFDVLSMTADLKKTPGRHHFYIEFDTGADGVEIPLRLRETYPERMTIVLQHQFANLLVSEHRFSVRLWFKGEAADLSIPFEAVTSFADPSEKFGLRFDEAGHHDAAAAVEDQAPSLQAPSPAGKPTESAEVVSLDQFRKK